MQTLADWLGSAVKPHMEFGKKRVLGLGSRKRLRAKQKTHFRAEVGLVERKIAGSVYTTSKCAGAIGPEITLRTKVLARIGCDRWGHGNPRFP